MFNIRTSIAILALIMLSSCANNASNDELKKFYHRTIVDVPTTHMLAANALVFKADDKAKPQIIDKDSIIISDYFMKFIELEIQLSGEQDAIKIAENYFGREFTDVLKYNDSDGTLVVKKEIFNIRNTGYSLNIEERYNENKLKVFNLYLDAFNFYHLSDSKGIGIDGRVCIDTKGIYNIAQANGFALEKYGHNLNNKYSKLFQARKDKSVVAVGTTSGADPNKDYSLDEVLKGCAQYFALNEMY